MEGFLVQRSRFCSRKKLLFVVVGFICACVIYASLWLYSLQSTKIKIPFIHKMEETMKTWAYCDAVCFDVDSTLITEEGLDELAGYLGKKDEIAALTNKAMGGSMTFRDALEARLNILRPSKFQVQNFVNGGKLEFTKGVRELISTLKNRGVDVYLVSGGFHALIKPLARKLGIPSNHVFANRILYHNDGSYAGFDKHEPTSAAGGKPKVAKLLKDTMGYKNLVFIGDGATDMEASPPADAFIGFGGNVIREAVKQKSKWYVYSFEVLLEALDNNCPGCINSE